MADEKKPLPENAPKMAAKSADEKSINDLLEEYAQDVKDKDIDDFLKESDGEEDEEIYEPEDESAEEESEKVLAEQGQPRRRGGGLLTMALIVAAFGAAGAGAYMYLNRDSGMTTIMGGFSGTNDDVAMPPPAIAANTPDTDEGPANDNVANDNATPVMPAAPAQPMPIMNEAAAPDATAAAPEMTSTETPVPGADVVNVPAPQLETQSIPQLEPAPAAAAPAEKLPPLSAGDTGAAQAVDAWASGKDADTIKPAMPGPDGAGNTAALLPEKTVEVIKAKPPVTKKSAAPAPSIVKAAPVPVKTVSAPKTTTPKAAAPKATTPAKAVSSGADAALPPPYLAIRAAKSTGTRRDTEGNVNLNIEDKTAATGATAAMVAQGGGRIDLENSSGAVSAATPAPALARPLASSSRAIATPESVPPLRTVPLAINNGRSMPPGTVVPPGSKVEARAYAELPETTDDTAPARMVMPSPTPAPTPAPSSATGGDASALVAQAMAAEKSGNLSTALTLYQKALEADAIYGDGKSIDRGMVYDHIGAIRARQ